MRRLATADLGFEAAFTALLDEARETTARVDAMVAEIIAAVRARGDAALCEYTARFDRLALTPATIAVPAAEIAAAAAAIPAELLAALDLAA
ncbi:MAG TPA: histidinol dehydrogenase, partial [Acetobacteraceae bacterium]|nr:histidinol dehydrogenase [Acetobacteraceae bacterium]